MITSNSLISDTVFFDINSYWWIYAIFIGFVVFMLALDLGAFQRTSHVVGFREALGWSVFWISLSLMFNAVFYFYALNMLPTHALLADAEPGIPQRLAFDFGLQFLTGFLIEKALAIDNLFVFIVVFSGFSVPLIHQKKILSYGILGAILFRALFIALGAKLMSIHYVVVFFGLVLIATGVKMAVSHAGPKDPGQNIAVKILRRFVPVDTSINGPEFFVRRAGRWFAIPLFLALVVIEFTDIVFAIDSVPAIFAVTNEPLIVFMSNILAILGMRSLYFLLVGILDRFVFLKFGLALVLAFVGSKMVFLEKLMGGKFPVTWSLSIIALCIGGSIVASLIYTRKR